MPQIPNRQFTWSQLVEVRDKDNEEWRPASFIEERRGPGYIAPYVALEKGRWVAQVYHQCRMKTAP